MGHGRDGVSGDLNSGSTRPAPRLSALLRSLATADANEDVDALYVARRGALDAAIASGSATGPAPGRGGKGRYHATSSLARLICPASPDSPPRSARGLGALSSRGRPGDGRGHAAPGRARRRLPPRVPNGRVPRARCERGGGEVGGGGAVRQGRGPRQAEGPGGATRLHAQEESRARRRARPGPISTSTSSTQRSTS